MKISHTSKRFHLRKDERGQEVLKSTLHRHLIDAIGSNQINIAAWERPRAIKYVYDELVNYATIHQLVISNYDLERYSEDLVDELIGYGPLQSLLEDERITEILVNGPRRIFIEKDGRLQLTKLEFVDEEHVLRVVERMLGPLGRRLDQSSPMVDARLPDGSRVNAIISPLALEGPCVSIRKFRKDILHSHDLLGNGSLNEPMLDLLVRAVQNRCNILISGGTGTGKTTLLNILSSHIGPSERVVTIEDTAELQLVNDHVVRLETRPPNVEGAGEVTARDLLRNSLRMRPDRIILGEVRGIEVLELLQAMNTGHDGSMSTIHANSTIDGLMRLEMLIGLTGHRMTEVTTRNMVSMAVDVLIHLARLPNGRRCVAEIREMLPLRDGSYVTNELYRCNTDTGRFEAVSAHPVNAKLAASQASSSVNRAAAYTTKGTGVVG